MRASGFREIAVGVALLIGAVGASPSRADDDDYGLSSDYTVVSLASSLRPNGTLVVRDDTAVDLDGRTLMVRNLLGRGVVLLGGGRLVVHPRGISDWAGSIREAGSFVAAGPGKIEFSYGNTYAGTTSIQGGTFSLGDGGTRGEIAGNIVDDGLLEFNYSNIYIYGGHVSGTGGLLVRGTGTSLITNTNSFTGPVVIDGGTLQLGRASNGKVGTLAAPVSVRNGGTLSGIGSVGDLTVAAGSTLAPGLPAGRLSATSAALQPGSLFRVYLGAGGQSSSLAVSGAAQLGGHLTATINPGYTGAPTTYTVLTAADGLRGAFTDVTNAPGTSPFVRTDIAYSANDVRLSLSRLSFMLAATTPNERAVAAALDALPFSNQLVAPILGQDFRTAAETFAALSGEVHADVRSALLDDGLLLREALLDRLRSSDPGARRFGDVGASGVTPDLSLWAEPFGSRGRFASTGDAAGARHDLGGILGGMELAFGRGNAVGLGIGYLRSRLDVSDLASSARADTVPFFAYETLGWGPVALRGGAVYAWHQIAVDRTVSSGSLFDATKAGYGADTGQVFGEVGYVERGGPVTAEPYGGLAFVHVGTGRFAEDGGVAALRGASASSDLGSGSLGLRLSADGVVEDLKVSPHLSVAWQHALGAVNPGATLGLVNSDVDFVARGVPVARNAALVGAGTGVALSPQVRVDVDYAGNLAHAVVDQGIRGRLTWTF